MERQRKRKPYKGPDALKTANMKTIHVHPEIYRQLSHEAIDEDQTLTERLHFVLCHAMNRLDLMPQTPEYAKQA